MAANESMINMMNGLRFNNSQFSLNSSQHSNVSRIGAQICPNFNQCGGLGNTRTKKALWHRSKESCPKKEELEKEVILLASKAFENESKIEQLEKELEEAKYRAERYKNAYKNLRNV